MLYFEIIPVEILRLILSRCLPESGPSNLIRIPEFENALMSIEFWKLVFDWMGFTKYIKRGLFNKDLMRMLEGDPYVVKSYSIRSPKDLFRILSYEYDGIDISAVLVREMLSHKNLEVKIKMVNASTSYSILLDNLDISENIFDIIDVQRSIFPYENIATMTEKVDYAQGRRISVRTGYYVTQDIPEHKLIMFKYKERYDVTISNSNDDITFKDGGSSFYNLLTHFLYNRFQDIEITYDDN